MKKAMKHNRPIESTVAPSPRIRKPATKQRSPGDRSFRVLIVEDNLQLLKLLTIRLCGMGYDVESARDGEAAWSSLCSVPFDVLITDNDMPRLKGLELVRRMRDNSFVLPVILMSGNMHWSDPELFKLLAPGTALRKPFSITELLRKMNELLPSGSLKAPQN